MKINDFPYDFILRHVPHDARLVANPGEDDCSVFETRKGLIVTTTDFVNARPAALSLGVGEVGDLGYLAVAASLSDLLGSGARPLGCHLGVQLAAEHGYEVYESIVSRALKCLRRYDVPLLGGDTKKGGALSVYGVGVGFAASQAELFLAN